MILTNFDLVLQMIRRSINSERYDDGEISDWQSLYAELKDQSVSAIPANILMKLAPQEEKDNIVRIVGNHVVNMKKYVHVQDLLTQLFQEKHLPFAIIKGLSVARYYPKPELRTLGDIDIVVLHEDYGDAYQLLLQNDFKEVSCPYEKHSEFVKNGVVIELHKFFVSTNDIGHASYIENQIQAGIHNPEFYDLKGCRFPVLPPLANGLVLLEHMSQHLESGIGLRHLLDWMMYVSHELDDTVWETSFAAAAEAAGLRRLAEVSAQLCVKYLGLTGVNWCSSADDALCDRLLLHIAQRGNFGRKEASSNEKARKLFSVQKNVVYWLMYLQRTGVQFMPFVRNHAILHPFAWLIRGISLLFRFFRDGNSLRDIRREQENAREIDSFLDDLGIRRISQGRTSWNGESFVKKL